MLLGKIQSQKLRYFGHIARHPSLQDNIALGYMPGTRRQGGQRRQWVNDITDLAGLSLLEVVTLAKDRWQYRQIVHKVAKAPHGIWHTRHGVVWFGHPCSRPVSDAPFQRPGWRFRHPAGRPSCTGSDQPGYAWPDQTCRHIWMGWRRYREIAFIQRQLSLENAINEQASFDQ